MNKLRAMATWIAERDLLRDLFLLAGAACFVRGAWLVYRPAGFLILGAFLMASAIFTVGRQ